MTKHTYKTRRYKSRKYKTRKYKSRKYKKKRTKKKALRRRRRSRRRTRRRRGGDKESAWKARFLKSAAKHPQLKDAIQTWGAPRSETKSLSALYKEVVSGDSRIEFTDNGPLRVINVVQMEIYPNSKQQFLLKEKKHFSPENTAKPIKERDMLLSEKIQGKETPIAAAMRGIAEELGANHKITVIAAPQLFKENTTNSWSYPNLQGVYRYFLGKAIVEGLPSPPDHKSFQTTEFNHDHSKKRIIEWAWEPLQQKIEAATQDK